MDKYIVGVDEVGRGPVAGPVAVGVVAYKIKDEKFLKEKLFKANDSKQMTEKNREEVFEMVSELKKENEEKGGGSAAAPKIFAKVTFVSAKSIDKIGIVPSIQKALNSSLENIFSEIEVEKDYSNIILKLDGGLKYDEKVKNQETIIKGDAKEFSIALASVVAKVVRDREMIKLSKKYPHYFLEKHKGYGTKQHIDIIKEKGLSDIHRKTFLKKYL